MAAPSTGAAATRISSRPSRTPAILVTPARGITRTASARPPGMRVRTKTHDLGLLAPCRGPGFFRAQRGGALIDLPGTMEQDFLVAFALFLFTDEFERAF